MNDGVGWVSDATSVREMPFGRAPHSPHRERLLQRVVERHVLPRLALRTPAIARPPRFGDGLSDVVPDLTRLALDGDAEGSRRVLHRLHESGASFSEMQIGLLAPAARRLDRLWRDDAVSFLDVTLAAGNIQQMMRFVALDLAPTHLGPSIARTILVAPTPGETHLLGSAMAAEFFRRDGWNVLYEPAPTRAGLTTRVAMGWIDVIGLSVTVRPDVEALATTIAHVRAASSNPDLLVIAGGEAMVADPTLVTVIGADATLAALPAAPARAHRLVSALPATARDGSACRKSAQSTR
jgi:MerR family transcriptional regulator, light-induced transcriptional regulator